MINNYFYKDLLNAVIKLKASIDVDVGNEPNTHQSLYHNDLIQVGRNPLYLKDWIQKGVYIVDDLFDENGNFFTVNDFILRYDINTNYLQFEGVLRAVKCFLNGRTFSKLKRPFVPEFYAILNKSKKGGSDFYKKITDYNHLAIKSQEKWSVELGCNDLDWNLIYTLPFSLHLESKFSWFQYRINTRILSTNTYLKRINILDDDLCTFCSKERETISHIMFYCEKVQPLWNEFQNFINSNTNNTLNISPQTMIFGIVNDQPDNKAVNVLMIWFKFYIYKCKMQNTILNFVHFQNYARGRIQSLHYNACISFNVDAFIRQWQPWLNNLLFDVNIT